MPDTHTPDQDWERGHNITPAKVETTTSIQREGIYTPNFWMSVPLQLNNVVWAYKNGDPDNTRTSNPVPEDNGKYLVYYYIIRYVNGRRTTIYLRKLLSFTQEERDANIPDKNGKDRMHLYTFCATRMANPIQVTIP